MKKITFLTILILLSAVFTVSAQTWEEIAKALPTPQEQKLDNQYYGASVAVDGNYAVIGAEGYNNSQGMAYVLEYDENSWYYIAEITASDGVDIDFFGCSVSISGDNIIIGA